MPLSDAAAHMAEPNGAPGEHKGVLYAKTVARTNMATDEQ